MRKVVFIFICLYLMLSGFVFAEGEGDDYGRSYANPVRYGETFTIKNVKTISGEWNTVTYKVIAAKLDNAGYAKEMKTAGYEEAIDTQNFDYAKVTFRTTVKGFKGNVNQALGPNIPTSRFLVSMPNGDELDGVEFERGFKDAYSNVFESYYFNKVYMRGKYISTTIAEAKLNKADTVFTLQGVVYLTIPKGKFNECSVWIMSSYWDDKNVHLALSNNVSQHIPKDDVLEYGDDFFGKFKTPAVLNRYDDQEYINTYDKHTSYYLGDDFDNAYMLVSLTYKKLPKGTDLDSLKKHFGEQIGTVNVKLQNKGSVYFGKNVKLGVYSAVGIIKARDGFICLSATTVTSHRYKIDQIIKSYFGINSAR